MEEIQMGFERSRFYRLPRGWTEFFGERIRQARTAGEVRREISVMRVVGWIARWTWGVHWDQPGASMALSLDEFLRGRRGSNGERLDQGAGIHSRRVLIRVLRHAEELGLLIRTSRAGASACWQLRIEDPAPEDAGEKGFPIFRPDRYFAVPLVWHDLRAHQPPALMVVVEALMEATFSFRQFRRAWMDMEELAGRTGLHPKSLYETLPEGLRRGFLVWRGGGRPGEARSFALRLRGDRVEEETGRLLEDLSERAEALRELLEQRGVAIAAELASRLAERGWDPEALQAFFDQEGKAAPSTGILIGRLERVSPEAYRVSSEEELRRRIVASWGRLGNGRR